MQNIDSFAGPTPKDRKRVSLNSLFNQARILKPSLEQTTIPTRAEHSSPAMLPLPPDLGASDTLTRALSGTF